MARSSTAVHPDENLLIQASEALSAQGIAVDDVIFDVERGTGQILFRGLGSYQVIFRAYLSSKQIGTVVPHLRATKKRTMLVADYITAKTAEILRTQHIQFADTAGNAYLFHDNPRIHIWIQGCKPKKNFRIQKPVTAFREKGLRVIFPLLCLQASALNAPYRQLADWASVALGTVANTIDGLTSIGYIRKTRKGLVLEDREKLLHRWVEEYPQQLRPRLSPRRYKVRNAHWWKELTEYEFNEFNIQLGGESAASVLTKYLQPEIVTIYGRPDIKKLFKRIGPAFIDDNGNLEILDPFWNFDIRQPISGYRMCPLLLVYSDLLASSEGRQLETADVLREKYNF